MAELIKPTRLTDAAAIAAAVDAALASGALEPNPSRLVPVETPFRRARHGETSDDDGFGYLVVDGRRLPGSNTYLGDGVVSIDGVRYASARAIRAALGERARIEWVGD